MAAGTKHFMFNRPDDWFDLGIADGLAAEETGLILRGGGKGIYTSLSLDTQEPETVWHRLRLDARISDNARLRLYLFCSGRNEAPEGGSRTMDEWLSAASGGERERFFEDHAQQSWDNPADLPLYAFRGRYLWFCMVFQSYDGREIAVERLKIEFPRTAFIDYLPQVYRGADSVNSFLARFISVFQSLYVDLEEDFDQMPARCDPEAASADFLQWLAECVAVPEPHLWSEDRLRQLLQRAVGLYRRKGTKDALREVVELYTGQSPLILEQFELASTEAWRWDGGALRRLYGPDRYTVTLLLRGPPEGGADAGVKLRRVIEAFKPVESVCNLVFLSEEIILGQHCYLGMNSRIGGSGYLVLDGRAAPSAPYLAGGGEKGDQEG